LIRYFEEDYYQVKLLVDEAHNLVDRSKAMYSAMFSRKDVIDLLEEAKTIKPSITRPITKLLNYMDGVIKEKEVFKAKMVYDEELDQAMLDHVNKVINMLDQFLTEHKKHPKRKVIRNSYFLLMQFVRISEFFGHAFRYKLEANYEDDIEVQILCFDASKHLSELIETRVRGVVLFSATLKPVDYFARLLTKGNGKYFEVPSPFSTKHLGLFMDVSTSTRYKDRKQSVLRIVDTLYAMLESKVGNYIAFFPSYKYMQMVLEQFDTASYDVTIQTRAMTIAQKDEVLQGMKEKKETSSILFSVLGGSFSEGIDYVSDMLVGVLIVGVALPAYNANNELLRSYFDEEGLDGFQYAYTYPGMNKVIQAVGRVIRTKEDKGIAVLLDDRYQMQVYKDLFPAHWVKHHMLEEGDFVQGYISQFWNQFEEDEE
jgi:DNA excision repair protein ERCC-2